MTPYLFWTGVAPMVGGVGLAVAAVASVIRYALSGRDRIRARQLSSDDDADKQLILRYRKDLEEAVQFLATIQVYRSLDFIPTASLAALEKEIDRFKVMYGNSDELETKN